MLILVSVIAIVAAFSTRVLASIAVPAATARVIGGSPASASRFGFAQVSLQLPLSDAEANSHQCGGSIIATDMILTAAHCHEWFSTVQLNRYDFSKDERYATFSVSSIENHPEFDEDSFQYDFSVVQISNTETTDTIVPVRLNDDPDLPKVGNYLSVFGWGATDSDSDGYEYPSVLQEGKVKAITNEDCEETRVGRLTLYDGEIYDDMVCAKEVGVDACSGDSGGPLVLQGKGGGLDLLVGLVSWGRGCAIYPGVYSRVSVGFDWIRQTVCYKSIKPPEYLECKPSERDPVLARKDAAETSTFAPVSTEMPTASPTIVPDRTISMTTGSPQMPPKNGTISPSTQLQPETIQHSIDTTDVSDGENTDLQRPVDGVTTSTSRSNAQTIRSTGMGLAQLTLCSVLTISW